MTVDFVLPELGEDIETGDVVKILISEGDEVVKDQTLMEIETDKAVIELPSPVDGSVKRIAVNTGDTIKVGQLLVTFDDNKSPKTEKDVDVSGVESVEEIEETPVVSGEDKFLETEPDKKAEVRTVFEQPARFEDSGDRAKIITISAKDREVTPRQEHVIIPASPSVRRLAREIGVDISKVRGTGPDGRITDDDVKLYSQKRLSEIGQYPEAENGDKSKYTQTDDGRIITEEMSKVRLITAERLTYSWKAPHVTQHDKADITEVEEYRKNFENKMKSTGVRVTWTSILTKIICHALKKFPKFNSSIDMDQQLIIYKNYINIGIAVDTDRGLLVPVIKDADKKDIIQISRELSDLSERSRNKKIKVEELQDSTFTISNLGGIGGTYFTPVINSPNVAILGVSRSVIEPFYIDDEFKPRLMLPLSLSYDHRIIDGADAARFTGWIVEALQNPINVLMHS